MTLLYSCTTSSLKHQDDQGKLFKAAKSVYPRSHQDVNTSRYDDVLHRHLLYDPTGMNAILIPVRIVAKKLAYLYFILHNNYIYIRHDDWTKYLSYKTLCNVTIELIFFPWQFLAILVLACSSFNGYGRYIFVDDAKNGTIFALPCPFTHTHTHTPLCKKFRIWPREVNNLSLPVYQYTYDYQGQCQICHAFPGRRAAQLFRFSI